MPSSLDWSPKAVDPADNLTWSVTSNPAYSKSSGGKNDLEDSKATPATELDVTWEKAQEGTPTTPTPAMAEVPLSTTNTPTNFGEPSTPPTRAQQSEKEMPPAEGIRAFFLCLVLLTLLVNFDAGVVPASLMKIRMAFRLDFTEGGLLGSLVYLGQTLACPISGYVLTRTQSQRRVLVAAVLSNAIATLLFALAPEADFLFVSRALIGFTQAPCIIYGPVWVDEYAPPESKTKWISALQGSASIGIVLGYAVSGAVPGQYSWRWCLCVQAWFIIIPGMVLLFIRGTYVNTGPGSDAKQNGDNKSSGGGDDDDDDVPEDTIMSQLGELSRCYLYIWLTLTISILYFVVTGIQFWVTDYMVTVLKAEQAIVTVMFSLCAVTGPVAGLIFGGTFIDYIGGYRDSARALCNALGVCVLFGICAVIFSIFAATIKVFAVCITCIWFILFFGGALLPTATGISVSSVPPHTRPLASACAMLFYNLIGYGMAPVVCGMVAEAYNLRVGFRFVLLSSILALAFVILAWFTALLGFHHLKDKMIEDGAEMESDDPDTRRVSEKRASLGLAGFPSSPMHGGKGRRASGLLQYVLAVPEVGFRAGNLGNMFKPVVPEALLHEFDERFAPQSRFSVAYSPGLLSNEYKQYATEFANEKRNRAASLPIVWTEINDLVPTDVKKKAQAFFSPRNASTSGAALESGGNGGGGGNPFGEALDDDEPSSAVPKKKNPLYQG